MSSDNLIESIASKVVSIIILILAVTVLFNILLSKSHRLNYPQQGKKITLIEEETPKDILPNTAFFTLYSIPENAEITLNGKSIGFTPIELPKLSAGVDHVFTVKHKLTKTDTFEINLQAGEVKREIRELAYEEGSLEINSQPIGAQIFINNKFTDKVTPASFVIPAGNYDVRLRMDNYASYGKSEHNIFVQPKKNNTLDIKLSQLYSISFQTEPRSNITIHEIDKSYFPHMRLPAGTYTIEAKLKGYDTLTKTISLNENKKFNYQLALQRNRLNITSFPQNASIRIENHGKYSPNMAIDNGHYKLIVNAPGYWEKKIPIHIKSDTELAVTLDAKVGPKMQLIIGGDFYMGGTGDFNQPIHSRSINDFYVSTTEITSGQWLKCAKDNACRALSTESSENMPAISMSWHETQNYINWLNLQGKAKYRLLTEAEWEYIAANKGKKFNRKTICQFENFLLPAKKKKDQSVYKIYIEEEVFDCPLITGEILPVASLEANQYGVYDILGNAQEWVEDCWHADYRLTPKDSQAWLDKAYGNCAMRVTRGGSFNQKYHLHQAHKRSFADADSINSNTSFRIARAAESSQ